MVSILPSVWVLVVFVKRFMAYWYPQVMPRLKRDKLLILLQAMTRCYRAK
jgi:hypothetical protein